MKTPDVVKSLLLASFLVLALWFGMGFLMPIMFEKPVDNSGTFGDGFGSVNALFSGLGFVALTYTILLQIKTNEEERSKEKFKYLFDYFSEIQQSVNELIVDNNRGLDAILFLLHEFDKVVANGKYKEKFIYLDNILFQLGNYQLMLLKNKRKLNEEEIYALQLRLSLLFFNYFSSFEDKEIDAIYKKTAYSDFVQNCKKVSNLLRKELIYHGKKLDEYLDTIDYKSHQ